MNPELHPQHQTLLITLAVIVVLLIGAILVYILTASSPVPPPRLPLESSSEISPETFEFSEFPDTSVDVTPPPVITNPVENLPKTNPFEAETNPFEGAYKNPFE